jgi:hypothetical protein
MWRAYFGRCFTQRCRGVRRRASQCRVGLDRRAHCLRLFDAADGYVFPPVASFSLLRLDIAWWLRWLADHLALVNAAKPVVLVENRAWDLGELWVTKRSKVPVLFARRLKTIQDVSALQNALANRAGRTGGIVLSSGKALATVWPLQYILHPLADRLVNEPLLFTLDETLLNAPYGGGTPTQPLRDIVLSPDDRTLTVLGEVMHFRGKEQRRILRKLVNAYYKGEKRLSSDILGGGADTFAKKFKGNSYLPRLKNIVRQQQGRCWFEL